MLIYKSHWWVFITNVSRSCLTLEASSFFCGFNVNFEFSHDSELFSMLNFWVFWRVVFKQRPTRYRLQARIKCYFSYLCLLFIAEKHCQLAFVFLWKPTSLYDGGAAGRIGGTRSSAPSLVGRSRSVRAKIHLLHLNKNCFGRIRLGGSDTITILRIHSSHKIATEEYDRK